MNKKILIALAVLAYLVLAFGVYTTADKVENVGGSFSFGKCITGTLDADNRAYNQDLTATGTVAYFTTSPNTGTTTLACSTQRASSIDLNIQFDASTTASYLTWVYEFSDNGIDWYGEDSKVVNTITSTTHGTATTTHTWRPGVESGVVRKNVTITPVASRYTRVSFDVSGANGALWAQLILKEEY